MEQLSTRSARRPLPLGTATAGVLIWNDITDEGREAFYRWHNGEHIPERMAIPGFVRGRRYASAGEPAARVSPQWFTLYEAASLDVLVSSAYLQRLNNPTPATTETLRHFRHTARSVCVLQRAHGPAVGGHALVLRFDAAAGDADLEGAQAQATEVLEIVEGGAGIVSTSLYGADTSASRIDTAESKTRSFDVPQLTVMVEASHADAARQAMDRIARADWRRHGLALREEHGLYSLEMCIG